MWLRFLSQSFSLLLDIFFSVIGGGGGGDDFYDDDDDDIDSDYNNSGKFSNCLLTCWMNTALVPITKPSETYEYTRTDTKL